MKLNLTANKNKNVLNFSAISDPAVMLLTRLCDFMV